MQYLVLDIETVKNDRAHDYFFTEQLAKADSRLKSKDKIEDDIQKQYEKSGLRWYLAKITAICASIFDDETRTTNETFDGCEDNERNLLIQFGNFILDMESTYDKLIIPIGKSSKAFDYPVLVGRYMFHDLGLPSIIYSSKPITDVDELFAKYSRNDQVSTLTNYAWGMGLEGKLHPDGGAKVQQWYDAQDFETIRTYCRQDVNICVEILKRYKPYQRTEI